jgi:hypothetical protein
MSKRLMVMALIALTVCFVSAAYAEVQNVKVGGDLTVIGVSRDNMNLHKDSFQTGVVANKGMGESGVVSIARVKIDANLTDNVDVTMRLLNERVWDTSSEIGVANTAVDIDLAYVTLKDFLKDVIGVPLTVKLGRQEIKIGSGLLIGDPDTNQFAAAGSLAGTTWLSDLSARKAFDGVVAVMDFNPLAVTAAAVKVSEATTTTSEDDVNAYILNGAYKLGVMDSNLELTYMLVTRNKENALALGLGDVNVYDARITAMPVTNLGVSAECAYMTQRDAVQRADRRTMSDYAILLGANYTLANVAMTPSFGLDYTRLSRYWNPLFEDVTPADLINVLFPNVNVQCFGMTLGVKPTTDTTVKLRLAYCRMVETMGTNLFAVGDLDGTKKNLGIEADLNLMYDYTSDVQFGLDLGYFRPGQAFVRDYRGAASQVVGSMKVTF